MIGSGRDALVPSLRPFVEVETWPPRGVTLLISVGTGAVTDVSEGK